MGAVAIALFVLEPVRAGVVSTLVDGEIWLLLALHQSTTTMGAIEGSVLVAGRGGALDFIAGVAKRAPLWVQRLGLEWLYRLCPPTLEVAAPTGAVEVCGVGAARAFDVGLEVCYLIVT